MAEAKPASHGKSPGRKVFRAKPLKRRSIYDGDSVLRALASPTDNKAGEKEREMATSFLQYW
jgi:hypothetical protein